MLIDEEFTLKKLEIFLAFMRTGNLARAAAELQTSNVSVHRAIHSLENALRCPLFKHEGRNLTPLESAYVLEERAQKLVADVVDSVRLTREAAGFSAERFKLGSLYSLTVKTVPQLIMGLKIRRSELNIDLILGSNFDLLYKLKNMEVDAILISSMTTPTTPTANRSRCFPTTSSSPLQPIHPSTVSSKSTWRMCATLLSLPSPKASPPIRTAIGCSSRRALSRRWRCRSMTFSRC